METISPSDKRPILTAKIADYRSVDVQAVRVVRSQEQSVEVIKLSPDESESVGHYEIGQIAASVVFEGLMVPVDQMFAV